MEFSVQGQVVTDVETAGSQALRKAEMHYLPEHREIFQVQGRL